MGRYYYGTISGKFWFGIQSSYDAENFKKQLLPNEGIEYYVYYVCGCYVEDNKLNYCHECFSDYESHFNGMDDIDKSSLNLEISNEQLLAFKNNHIKYNFYNSDLEYVQIKLIELENIIGYNIIEKLEYKIDESNDIIENLEYDINNDIINNINNNNYINNNYILELIARWCFGKQIEYAINVNDYCYIYCEL
jgi:hypothetical protein